MLASNRVLAERIRPPRALYCDFPLGRPLGRPADAAFQHRVLQAAFALLERESGPVLADFPESIRDDDVPAACAIPPRLDDSVPAAIDEVRALRPAWERTFAKSARTQIGRAISVDEITESAARFLAVARGASIAEAGFRSGQRLVEEAMDIRAYYEEAALALMGDVPAARSVEAWIYQSTEMGRLLVAAANAVNDAKVQERFGIKYHIVPVTYFEHWKNIDRTVL